MAKNLGDKRENKCSLRSSDGNSKHLRRSSRVSSGAKRNEKAKDIDVCRIRTCALSDQRIRAFGSAKNLKLAP